MAEAEIEAKPEEQDGKKTIQVYSKKRMKRYGMPWPWKTHTVWRCKDNKFRVILGFIPQVNEVVCTIPFTKSSMPIQYVDKEKFAEKVLEEVTDDPKFKDFLEQMKREWRPVKVEDLDPDKYKVVVLD